MENWDGTLHRIDDGTRGMLATMLDSFATEGQRSLGIAWREMPANAALLTPDDERQLVFAGYCVFLDPPKASAATALAGLAAAGVRTKVISGDNQLVVHHLVDALNLRLKGILTGSDIEGLNDHALAAAVEDNDLFCRVSPDQKSRIVRALQSRGHTVGFLGDGINDAPAIRCADVGISVAGATDVAREAADMILLRPDLGVLVDGIAEGRRTFVNILKYVRMVTSSNLGNMLSMAVASLWLPFLPLTAVQILVNNFLYDASEIGIPFDRVEASDVAAPHAWNMRDILRFMLILGPVSSVFDLVTFLALRDIFSVSVEQFRTAWFLEFDGDPDPRHIRHPHRPAGLARLASSSAHRDVAGSAWRSRADCAHTIWCGARIHGIASKPALGVAADCYGISGHGRDRQALRSAGPAS